jgi:predicted GNAT family N-acyltransferase
MNTLVSFTIEDKVNYQQSLAIREKVFIQEQSVSRALEVENEAEATYYLLLVDGKPAGTARWRKTAKGIKLERFAVLSGYRNQNLGTVLLKHILDSLKNTTEKIYLHSQLRAVNYYQRQGFIMVGDEFVEADIRHVMMEKD